ncbi:MAG: response regulator [Pirellulaceae bacterium]|nr:response regulator [Pirellulaceae bacterium]
MTTRILLVDDSPTHRLLFQRVMEEEAENEVRTIPDAREALSLLQSKKFDVVVTDMHMPEMSGLELVQEMKQRHPDIPVILLTGAGSEAMATRALRDGAAGYVAKDLASEMLIGTVQNVVSMSRTRFDIDRITTCSNRVDIQLSLINDPSVLPEVVGLAQKLAQRIGVTHSTGMVQVGTAVDAALRNALFRGNLEIPYSVSTDEQFAETQKRIKNEPYKNRHIKVQLELNEEELKIVVADEGKGFDVKENSKMGLSLSGQRMGRGLILMWAFMDRVNYSQAGNRVTLVKSAVKKKAEPEVAKVDTSFGTLEAEDGSKTIKLTKKRLIIGRDTSCDIPLVNHLISSHHCILYLHEGWWFVRDMESRNGIRVNSAKLVNSRLSPGAKLTVGEMTFVIQYEPYRLGSEGPTPPADPF